MFASLNSLKEGSEPHACLKRDCIGVEYLDLEVSRLRNKGHSVDTEHNVVTLPTLSDGSFSKAGFSEEHRPKLMSPHQQIHLPRALLHQGDCKIPRNIRSNSSLPNLEFFWNAAAPAPFLSKDLNAQDMTLMAPAPPKPLGNACLNTADLTNPNNVQVVEASRHVTKAKKNPDECFLSLMISELEKSHSASIEEVEQNSTDEAESSKAKIETMFRQERATNESTCGESLVRPKKIELGSSWYPKAIFGQGFDGQDEQTEAVMAANFAHTYGRVSLEESQRPDKEKDAETIHVSGKQQDGVLQNNETSPHTKNPVPASPCVNEITNNKKSSVSTESIELQNEAQSKDIAHIMPGNKDNEYIMPENKDNEHIMPENKDTERIMPENKDNEHIMPENKDTERTMPENKDNEHIMPENKDTERTMPKNKDTGRIMPENKDTEHVMPGNKDSEHIMPEKKGTEHIVRENKRECIYKNEYTCGISLTLEDKNCPTYEQDCQQSDNEPKIHACFTKREGYAEDKQLFSYLAPNSNEGDNFSNTHSDRLDKIVEKQNLEEANKASIRNLGSSVDGEIRLCPLKDIGQQQPESPSTTAHPSEKLTGFGKVSACTTKAPQCSRYFHSHNASDETEAPRCSIAFHSLNTADKTKAPQYSITFHTLNTSDECACTRHKENTERIETLDKTFITPVVRQLNPKADTEKVVSQTSLKAIEEKKGCFGERTNEEFGEPVTLDTWKREAKNVKVVLENGIRKIIPRKKVDKGENITLHEPKMEAEKPFKEHEIQNDFFRITHQKAEKPFKEHEINNDFLRTTDQVERVAASRSEGSIYTETDSVNKLLLKGDKRLLKVHGDGQHRQRRDQETNRSKPVPDRLDSSWIEHSQISLDRILGSQTNGPQVEAIRRLNKKTRLHALLASKTKASKGKVLYPSLIDQADYSVYQTHATCGLPDTHLLNRRNNGPGLSWIQIQEAIKGDPIPGPNEFEEHTLPHAYSVYSSRPVAKYSNKNQIKATDSIDGSPTHTSVLRDPSCVQGDFSQTLPVLPETGDGLLKCSDFINNLPNYYTCQLKSRGKLAQEGSEKNPGNKLKAITAPGKQKQSAMFTNTSLPCKSYGRLKRAPNVNLRHQGRNIPKRKSKRSGRRLKTEYIIVEPTPKLNGTWCQVLNTNLNKSSKPTTHFGALATSDRFSSKLVQNRNFNKSDNRIKHKIPLSVKHDNTIHHKLKRTTYDSRYSVFPQTHLVTELERSKLKMHHERRVLQEKLRPFFRADVKPQPSHWEGLEKLTLYKEPKVIADSKQVTPDVVIEERSTLAQGNEGKGQGEDMKTPTSFGGDIPKREQILVDAEKDVKLVDEFFGSVDGTASEISLIRKSICRTQSGGTVSDDKLELPNKKADDLLHSETKPQSSHPYRVSMRKKRRESKAPKQKRSSHKRVESKTLGKPDNTVKESSKQGSVKAGEHNPLLPQSQTQVSQGPPNVQQENDPTPGTDQKVYPVDTQLSVIEVTFTAASVSESSSVRDAKLLIAQNLEGKQEIGGKEKKASTHTAMNFSKKTMSEIEGNCVYCGCSKKMLNWLGEGLSCVKKNQSFTNTFPYRPISSQIQTVSKTRSQQNDSTEPLCDVCYTTSQSEYAVDKDARPEISEKTPQVPLIEKDLKDQVSPNQSTTAPAASVPAEKVSADPESGEPSHQAMEVAASPTSSMPDNDAIKEVPKKSRFSEASIESHIKRMELAYKMKGKPPGPNSCCKKMESKHEDYKRFTDKAKAGTVSTKASVMAQRASPPRVCPKSCTTGKCGLKTQEHVPKVKKPFGPGHQCYVKVMKCESNDITGERRAVKEMKRVPRAITQKDSGRSSAYETGKVHQYTPASGHTISTNSTKDFLPYIAADYKTDLTKSTPRWLQYDICNVAYRSSSLGSRQYMFQSPTWRGRNRISLNSYFLPNCRSLYQDERAYICTPPGQTKKESTCKETETSTAGMKSAVENRTSRKLSKSPTPGYGPSKKFKSPRTKYDFGTKSHSPRADYGPGRQPELSRTEYSPTTPPNAAQRNFGPCTLLKSCQKEYGPGTPSKLPLIDYESETLSKSFQKGHGLVKASKSSQFDGGIETSTCKSAQTQSKPCTKTIKSHLQDHTDKTVPCLLAQLGYLPATSCKSASLYSEPIAKKYKPATTQAKSLASQFTNDARDYKATDLSSSDKAFVRSLRRTVDLSYSTHITASTFRMNSNKMGRPPRKAAPMNCETSCQKMLDNIVENPCSWIISTKKSTTEVAGYEHEGLSNTTKRMERTARAKRGPQAVETVLVEDKDKTSVPLGQKSPRLVKSCIETQVNEPCQAECKSTLHLSEKNQTSNFLASENNNECHSRYRRPQYNVWRPNRNSQVFTSPGPASSDSLHRYLSLSRVAQPQNASSRNSQLIGNSLCEFPREISDEILPGYAYQNSYAKSSRNDLSSSFLRDPRKYISHLPYTRARKPLLHQRLILSSLPNLTACSRQPVGASCLQYNIKRKL